MDCRRSGARSSQSVPSEAATDSSVQVPCVGGARGSVWSGFFRVRRRQHSLRGPNEHEGNTRPKARDSPAARWIRFQHASHSTSALRERAGAADGSRPERSRAWQTQESNRVGLSLPMWRDRHLCLRQRHSAERLHCARCSCRCVGRTLTAGTTVVAQETKHVNGTRWIRIGHAPMGGHAPVTQ